MLMSFEELNSAINHYKYNRIHLISLFASECPAKEVQEKERKLQSKLIFNSISIFHLINYIFLIYKLIDTQYFIKL